MTPNEPQTDIDWSVPEPRSGFLGQWDRFMGPGATNAEQWLELGAAAIAAGAMAVYAFSPSSGWTALQSAVAILMALDLAGGVVTNATSSAKRWYHRPGQGPREHLSFVAVHAVHLLLIAWLFLGGDWTYFLGTYGFLLAAALAVAAVPRYLKRPAAFALYVLALLLSLYVFASPGGLEWFLPVFYLKLLVSHLLPEVPYSSGKG